MLSNSGASDSSRLDNVYLLISKEKYEKAVKIIAIEYNYDVREGYRDVAIIIMRNNRNKKKTLLSEFF